MTIRILTIPLLNYKIRLLIIVASITVLLWSGLEDNHVWGVVLLGWFVAILATTVFIMSRFGNLSITQSTLLKLSPLIGAIIGASASISTALLMLFKDVRHAHAFPDYPPQMIFDTITRLPFWALSSALILFSITGFGLLYRNIKHIEFDDKTQTKAID